MSWSRTDRHAQLRRDVRALLGHGEQQHGLVGFRERLAVSAGRSRIDVAGRAFVDSRPGAGTAVRMELPRHSRPDPGQPGGRIDLDPGEPAGAQ